MNYFKKKVYSKEIFFLSLSTFLVYIKSFGINFIWDDKSIVLGNPFIKSFSYIFQIFLKPLSPHFDKFYRPMQNLSYMADFFFYKFNYHGYHLTNIILHICSVIALFYLLLRLTSIKRISFFASLLYAISPIGVESVAYISGRADTLVSLFIILAFIGFLKDKVFISSCLYLCALWSKEYALVYLLAVLAYGLFMKKADKRFAISVGSFFLITMFYFSLRFFVIGKPIFASAYPLFSRLLLCVKAFGQYVVLIFFPSNLHMAYSVNMPSSFWDKEVLMSIIIILTLVYLFFMFLRKEKEMAFFVAWFFIFLLPYSGILPINAFFAEHFVSLASVGLFVCFVYVLFKARSKLFIYGVYAIFIFLFSITTMQYSIVWGNPEKFYSRIIQLSPRSFAAYNNLGILNLDKGNLKLAEALFQRALRVNPLFLEARLNLARLFYVKGEYAEAIRLAKSVLLEQKKNSFALNYLGTFYLKNGDTALAEKYYKKAVKEKPFFIPFWRDLYIFYRMADREKESRAIGEIIGEKDKYALADIYFEDALESFRDNQLEQALSSVDKALALVLDRRFLDLKDIIVSR